MGRGRKPGQNPPPALVFWKRGDLLFLAVLVLLAGTLILLSRLLFQGNPQDSRQAEITVNGHSVMTITLPASTDSPGTHRADAHRADVPGTGITVGWDDGGIWVEESPCPDQVCVRTGKISRPSQVVACLPEKLLIQIQRDHDGMKDGPDLIVG